MQTIFRIILDFGIIEIFIVVFLAINLFTFLLYMADKRKAKKNKWRISEAVLIFFTIMMGGIGAFFGMVLLRHKTKHIKFKAVTAIGLIIATIPLIHLVHALTLDRIVHYLEIYFYSENLPEELDGYRIAFMADFHTIPHEEMRLVVDELNRRNIDLLLLGGDFSRTNNHYQGTLAEIAQTNTTHGIFGVVGNHDRDYQLYPVKSRLGIGLLSNSGVSITEGFYLAGVGDLWWGRPDIGAATAGANPDDFILLLSHHPDISMQQPTSHVDLILAGHTHGGQITFFGYPFVLSPIWHLRGGITSYGTRFAHGFAYSADGTPVFTSRGVGVYYNIPRVFARPEVVIVSFRLKIEN